MMIKGAAGRWWISTYRPLRAGYPQECLRDLYTLYGRPELAGRWIDGLIEDCREAGAKEVRGMPALSSDGGARSWPGTPPEPPSALPRA
jgi:hypothetical protein